MSDEKPKPFAEARDGRLVVGEVTVNYDVDHFGALPMNRDRFPELAAVLNAAVEQREAKLVAAAERIAREAWEYHNRPDVDQREGFGDGARGVALHIASRIRREARALSHDFVPLSVHEKVATELAIERTRTHGKWMPMFEALAERHAIDAEALSTLAGTLGIMRASRR